MLCITSYVLCRLSCFSLSLFLLFSSCLRTFLSGCFATGYLLLLAAPLCQQPPLHLRHDGAASRCAADAVRDDRRHRERESGIRDLRERVDFVAPARGLAGANPGLVEGVPTAAIRVGRSDRHPH